MNEYLFSQNSANSLVKASIYAFALEIGIIANRIQAGEIADNMLIVIAIGGLSIVGIKKPEADNL